MNDQVPRMYAVFAQQDEKSLWRLLGTFPGRIPEEAAAEAIRSLRQPVRRVMVAASRYLSELDVGTHVHRQLRIGDRLYEEGSQNDPD